MLSAKEMRLADAVVVYAEAHPGEAIEDALAACCGGMTGRRNESVLAWVRGVILSRQVVVPPAKVKRAPRRWKRDAFGPAFPFRTTRQAAHRVGVPEPVVEAAVESGALRLHPGAQRIANGDLMKWLAGGCRTKAPRQHR